MVQGTDAHTSPENDFNTALGALTNALEEAAKAAQALQGLAPAVANLTGLIAELEGRMERARQVLGQGATAASGSPARPVALPPRDDASGRADARSRESAEDEEASGSSACFLLEVRAVSGSLDLKAVDSSVNGTPDVVDVALLDYDGRRATLKVWFEESANLPAARASLRENLQRHLGGQPAEISLERAEESAA